MSGANGKQWGELSKRESVRELIENITKYKEAEAQPLLKKGCASAFIYVHAPGRFHAEVLLGTLPVWLPYAIKLGTAIHASYNHHGQRSRERR